MLYYREMEVLEETDEAIVSRIQQGYTNEIGTLIDRYESKLKRYLEKNIRTREDITDILQDVFVKTYTNIHRFDIQQRFSPWIYRIAHNEMVNYIKKKKSLPFSWFEPDVLIPFLQESTDESVLLKSDRAYEKERIEKILDKIPPAQREILTLYFYEELSYKEISDVLRIPIATVGVRLTRAKKQVEQLLQTTNA